jgi:hypothetical protein
MANFLYDNAREKFLNGDISWSRDTFKVLLLTSDYIADKSTHTNLTDIAQASRIATSDALTNKGITSGSASASNTTFTGVDANKVVKSMVIVKQNPTDTENQTILIAHIDTADGITGQNGGLTTTGSDIQIDWAGTDDIIFKL